MPPLEGLRRSRVTHVYLWPSQWGQQACDHLLHHAVAVDVKVTLIVPARHIEKFRKWKPAIEQWDQYASVADAVDQLAAQGRPIDYISDLYADAIRARMLREAAEDGVRSVIYVTSGAERHVRDAEAFVDCADLVLIEKPFSIFLRDLALSPLAKAATRVNCADHYLFRPGVLLTLPDASPNIMEFLKRHRDKKLRYTFVFEEEEKRDNPDERPGAYRDGSILDIAVVHGLGPIARILLPAIGDVGDKLADQVEWTAVAPMTGTDLDGRPMVGTVAETGVQLQGKLTVDWSDDDSAGTTHVELDLRSVKGVDRFRRSFRFEVIGSETQHSYGVSLGASGATVTDDGPDAHVYATLDGGEQSDRSGGRSGAANAQAAMLRGLLEDRPDPLAHPMLLSLASAQQIVALGYRAQGLAAFVKRRKYPWGGPTPDVSPLTEVTDDRRAEWTKLITTKGIDFPAQALGLTAGQTPLHRIITYLGDEGEGNGDLNRFIRRRFQRGQPEGIPKLDKERCWAFTVQRDEGWAREQGLPPNARTYTLDVLLRDVAAFVGVSLPARPDPAEALRRHFEDEARKHFESETEDQGEPLLLLFNGIGRLSLASWQRLARVIAAMGPKYRIILLTSSPDRTAGLVVRTEAAMESLDVLGRGVWEPWATGQVSDDSLSKLREDLRESLQEMAGENVTLERQLRAFVEFVAVPWARDRITVREPEPEQRLQELVRAYLAAAALPEPLSLHPEAFMDRLAALALARLSPADRAAIRDLAIAAHVSVADVELLHPRLLPSLDRGEPVRALFELRPPDPESHTDEGRKGGMIRRLFPRVCRVASTWTLDQVLSVDDQVNRRLHLLSLGHETTGSEETPKDRVDRLLDVMKLVGGSDLASLPLGQGRFEELILNLVDQLAGQSKGKSPALAMEVVDLLVAGDDRETALGLSARAHLLALAGTMLVDSAGTDVTRAHAGLQCLRGAWAIASYGLAAAEDPVSVERQAGLVGCTARLIVAELVQVGLWKRLVGDRDGFKGTFRRPRSVKSLDVESFELKRIESQVQSLENALEGSNYETVARSWGEVGRGWRALALWRYVQEGSAGDMTDAIEYSLRARAAYGNAGLRVRVARSELESLLFENRSMLKSVTSPQRTKLVKAAASHPALGAYVAFLAWSFTGTGFRGNKTIAAKDRPRLVSFRERFSRTGQSGLRALIDGILE